jgi:outer membrane receptor protein involved in Fe transport
LGVGGPAAAAPARIKFFVPAKRYSEALLDVAQQANVTLIGAGACDGTARGISGAMTLAQALDQLLEGAPCTWSAVAPGAVEIRRRARAATPAAPAPPVVSELLVTATKRVRDPRELAVAVTAISGQELRGRAAADVADASGQFAGVLSTNLGPGRNKLLLRGLSDGVYTGRARSTVATYLDDIPLNWSAPDPDLRLVDVERVEVARGPQGALYGAGSITGVYRIVSRRPDLSRFGGELRATAADTRGGSPSGAVEGHVNVPVLRGRLGLRMSGYEERQGGYLDDVNLGRKDVDETRRRGGRASLLARPADDWSIQLTGAAQRLRSRDTHYTRPGMGLTRASRVPEPHANDIAMASLTVKGAWDWAELTSSTGFVRHAFDSIYDATEVQKTYTDIADTSIYTESNRTRMLVQDLYLTSRGAGPLDWLVGVYASSTKGHSPSELIAQVNLPSGVIEGMVYRDDRRDRTEELAAYGEVSYLLADDWRVAFGGRLFTHRTRTRSLVVSERFPRRSLDRESHFTSFSPKVSLQREFGEGDLAYLVFSEGHRGGGVNSSGAKPHTIASREVYQPDRLRNLEAGLKLTALDNRLAVNSAAFYALWKNVQTDQFRDSGIPYTTNAGDVQVFGLEGELAWRWTENLTVQLNGRVARADTTRVNTDFVPELANGLPGAPPFSGGAAVTYRREVFDDWLLGLAAETTYVGRSGVTWNPSTLPKMGGYFRNRLVAEVSRDGRGVQLFVTNPTDAFDDTFAFGNPFNPFQDPQITPQRPRTVGVTLFAGY